jgi:hypothetical protein
VRDTREHRDLGTVVWLAATTLALRGAAVLSLGDVFFYGEELEKGTAAKGMLDSVGVAHHHLAYHYYEGGGFVVSHLKALAFLLVGENLLAHKLVAAGFVLAVLLVGYAFVRDAFGRRAALWFGLLYAFSPPTFQKLSLISLGIHFEACLFVLGALGLTSRILRDEDARRGLWFALGVVCGFGLYFSYQVGLVAAACLAVLGVRRPRALFLRGSLPGLAGTAVGALPLVWMYSLVGDALFDIHGADLTAAGSGERLLPFLRAIFVEGALGGVGGPWLWTTAVAGGLAVGLGARGSAEGGSRAGLALPAVYLALFAVVFALSDFIPARVYHGFLVLRLAPLWVVGLVPIAVGLARLEVGRDGARRWASVAGGLLLAAGGVGALAVVGEGRPSTPVRNGVELYRTKGYVYSGYFPKFVKHLPPDDEERLEILLSFDEADRDWLVSEACAELFKEPLPDAHAAQARARAVVEAVAPEYVEALEVGLGRLLLLDADWDLGRALESALAAPDGLRERLLEGLGRVGSGAYPTAEALAAEAAFAPGLPDPEPFLVGLGQRLYDNSTMRLLTERSEAFIEARPAGERAAWRLGFERARARHRLE